MTHKIYESRRSAKIATSQAKLSAMFLEWKDRSGWDRVAPLRSQASSLSSRAYRLPLIDLVFWIIYLDKMASVGGGLEGRNLRRIFTQSVQSSFNSRLRVGCGHQFESNSIAWKASRSINLHPEWKVVASRKNRDVTAGRVKGHLGTCMR